MHRMRITQKGKKMNSKNQQKKKEIDWMITLVPLALKKTAQELDKAVAEVRRTLSNSHSGEVNGSLLVAGSVGNKPPSKKEFRPFLISIIVASSNFFT